jgi:hypothetical protein
MKKRFLHIALFFSLVCFSQNKQLAQNEMDFVPKNWKIIAKAEGDLNTDRIADLVLVIEDTKEKNIVSNNGLGASTLNTNPRLLLVLFKNNKNKFYLDEKNKINIPSEGSIENSCLEDPFLSSKGIEITKGLLKLSLRYWLSCGSWEININDYTFRLKNNQFELIGYDTFSVHRASGEIDRSSYNFVTKRKSITTGENISEEDEKPITQWSTIVSKSKLTFGNIEKDPDFGWQ